MPDANARDVGSRADPSPEPAHRTPAGRTTLVVAAMLVVAGLVAGVVWFLGRDAPDPVDIDAAARLAETGGGAARTEAPAEASAVTWVVDADMAPFSLEASTGTFVGFRIGEELARVGSTEAVGRTPQVEGTLVFADGCVRTADISADVTAIVSDQPRRDRAIQAALDTTNHPTADFALEEPTEVGALDDGEITEVDVDGTLTVNGTPNRVTVPLQAVRHGEVVVVTGSLEVVFDDYGIELPTAPIVISVEDHGEVEIQLYLRPVPVPGVEHSQ